MSSATADSAELDNMKVAKVVIIGAGACGLQCAHDLVTKHHVDPDDIVILEARNRIGGRIHTTHETRIDQETGKSTNFALDHGACWVHGTGMDWNTPLPELVEVSTSDSSTASSDSSSATAALSSTSLLTNPIVTLLSQTTDESIYSQLDPVFLKGNPWMRPKTVVLDQRQLALYAAGRRLDNDQHGLRLICASLQQHFDLLQLISEAGKELYRNGRGMDTISQSVHDVMNDIVLDSNVGDDSLSDADRSLVSSLTPFFMHLLECWHGAAIQDLQVGEFIVDQDKACSPVSHAAAGDDTEYTCVGDFYGPHCTVKRGMGSVLEPLLDDGIRERVHLEQEVTKIRFADDRHILVETASGLNLRADACVSTLTVECLKTAVADGMFEPRLGADKEKAISMTNMGCYKKVLLTFDRIFWAKDEAFIGLVLSGEATSPLGHYLLINNLWLRRGIPCLEAVLFGNSGRWAIGKSDQEIRAAVLEFMKEAAALDDDLDQICSDVHVTRWEEDRFSRGAYSNLSLGASVRHIDELRQREYDGHLVIAGEGTVFEFEGSVHAALLSGCDAADQVKAVLSLP